MKSDKRKLVIVFITNDEMKKFGYDDYRQDYPEFAFIRDNFHYLANDGLYVPAYMIARTHSVDRAKVLFPEMFL